MPSNKRVELTAARARHSASASAAA